jgi:predicted Rossmann fold nucleotide-binding protein DprA/Smf involved in DNA uptake
MKVIIAGSRSIVDYEIVRKAIEESKFNIDIVVSGCARGVDTFGEQWAIENNIKIEKHPADWNRYGKRAGYLRNEEMAKVADALIAVWDGESNGTAHMIKLALKYKLKIFIYTTGGMF